MKFVWYIMMINLLSTHCFNKTINLFVYLIKFSIVFEFLNPDSVLNIYIYNGDNSNLVCQIKEYQICSSQMHSVQLYFLKYNTYLKFALLQNDTYQGYYARDFFCKSFIDYINIIFTWSNRQMIFFQKIKTNETWFHLVMSQFERLLYI